MKERVQKLMAQANIGSRRACEELIRQGRVRVNGQTIHLGDQADPDTDVIELDGEKLKFETTFKRYFAVNKPLNVLSSNSSTWDDERMPVRDLIPFEGHLFSIGRLDAESDGLMVLTNDGELTNQLTHPRFQHTKTYKVVVYGSPTQQTLDTWEQGVYLEEGLTAPCSIRVQQREAEVTVLKIVMIEGKKRQIRRVATMLGHPVKRLTRTHIGKLELGKLKAGEWYELNEEEVKLMTTPASDLTYIRKLRREQREQRKRDFIQRAKEDADGVEPGSRSSGSFPSRATARPGQTAPGSSSSRPASRPVTRTLRGKPVSGGRTGTSRRSEGDKRDERRDDKRVPRRDSTDSERGERTERSDRPRRSLVSGGRTGTSRRSEGDERDERRDDRRAPRRDSTDSERGERTERGDRPKRSLVSGGRTGTSRRSESDNRDDRSDERRAPRRDSADSERGDRGDRPKRSPISGGRSKPAGRARSDDDRQRDTTTTSTGSTETDRSERSDRPQRKPSGSRKPTGKPRSGKPGTRKPGSGSGRRPGGSGRTGGAGGSGSTGGGRSKAPRKGRR